MNESARPQTSRNRDRALARLQSITTRTAIAASMATVGFGGLAAVTYSGTSDATTANTTVPATVVGGGATDTTTDTTAGTTNGASSGLQAVPAPTASTRHKSHVTSGGSGH
jgi:hypothetical protein